MSLLKNAATAWIKKIFSDLHNAIIGIILLALISGTGIVFFFLKKQWFLLKNNILLPTPLWATIALVLAAYLYIHVRMKSNRSFLLTEINNATEKLDEVKKSLRKQKFEKELLSYHEISECLATLRLFQPSLTGFDDWVLDFKKDLFGTNDTHKTREEIVNDLQKSLDDYNLTINKYSVSIQENIFEVLKTILKIFEKELSSLNAIGTMFENKDNREIFYERIESYRTLNAKTEEAQKMIRKRIEEIS